MTSQLLTEKQRALFHQLDCFIDWHIQQNKPLPALQINQQQNRILNQVRQLQLNGAVYSDKGKIILDSYNYRGIPLKIVYPHRAKYNKRDQFKMELNV